MPAPTAAAKGAAAKGPAQGAPPPPLRFRALGTESLAIVSLPEAAGGNGSSNGAEALDWLATALPAARKVGGANGGIAALAAGGVAGPTSVVVPESALRAVPAPLGATVDQPWVALEATALKPVSPATALAAVGAAFAAAGVRWRALPAAEASGLVLVREEDLPAAAVALVRGGHAVGPPSRVCPPLPEEDEAAAEKNSQYVGAWSLLKREQPVGNTMEEHGAGEHGPLRIQAPSGVFAEVRIPRQVDDFHKQESCGGFHAIVDAGSRRLSVRHRAVDFQPPDGCVLCTQVKFDHEVMGELSHPRTRCREEYIEAWTKVDSGPIVALELAAESLPAGGEVGRPRAGYWLFCGDRFARVVGPARGEGLVAGACSASVAQLEKLAGAAAVREELRQQYEASWGRVETPGRLRVVREAWGPQRAGELFYDVATSVGGTITIAQNEVVHRLPSGAYQRWRIKDWDFDPFRPPAPAVVAAAPEQDASDSSSPSCSSSPAKQPQPAREASPAPAPPASNSSDSSAPPSRSASAASAASEKSAASSAASASDSSKASKASSRSRKKKHKKKHKSSRHEEGKKDRKSRSRSRRRRHKHRRRRRRSRSASAAPAVAVEAAPQPQQQAYPFGPYQAPQAARGPPPGYPPYVAGAPHAAAPAPGAAAAGPAAAAFGHWPPGARPPGAAQQAGPPPGMPRPGMPQPGMPPPGMPPHVFGGPPPGFPPGQPFMPGPYGAPPGFPQHGPPPPGVWTPGGPGMPPPMGCPPPRPLNHGDPIAVFVAENRLDGRVEGQLRSLPQDLLQRVLDEGPVRGDNPSAIVTSRIRREEDAASRRDGSDESPARGTSGAGSAPAPRQPPAAGEAPATLAVGAKLLVRSPGPPPAAAASLPAAAPPATLPLPAGPPPGQPPAGPPAGPSPRPPPPAGAPPKGDEDVGSGWGA